MNYLTYTVACERQAELRRAARRTRLARRQPRRRRFAAARVVVR